jgi:hypothetical protein
VVFVKEGKAEWRRSTKCGDGKSVRRAVGGAARCCPPTTFVSATHSCHSHGGGWDMPSIRTHRIHFTLGNYHCSWSIRYTFTQTHGERQDEEYKAVGSLAGISWSGSSSASSATALPVCYKLPPTSILRIRLASAGIRVTQTSLPGGPSRRSIYSISGIVISRTTLLWYGPKSFHRNVSATFKPRTAGPKFPPRGGIWEPISVDLAWKLHATSRPRSIIPENTTHDTVTTPKLDLHVYSNNRSHADV